MDTSLFFDLTKRKKWEELEEAWLKLVGDPPSDEEFYTKLIEGMIRRKAAERCDEMLGLLVQEMSESGRFSQALNIARVCFKHLPAPAALRAAVLAALEERYGNRKNFNTFLEVARLKTAENAGKAFAAFMTLISLDVDEAYMHKSWGVGIVTAIDPVARKVTLRFAGRPLAEFTIAGAREYLTRLPASHFLARAAREPEQIKKMVDEKPAEFAKLAIKSLGNALRVAELRSEMTQYLMDAAEWKRWWNHARDRIRVDPYIDFSGSAMNATISLRRKPKSVYGQAFEALESGETPRERMNAARNCVRLSQTSPIPAEELARIERWVLDQFNEAIDCSRRIEMFSIMQTLGKIGGAHASLPADTLDNIVKYATDLPKALAELEVYEYQAAVLEAIQRSRQDWLEVFEAVIPDLRPRLVSRAMRALTDGNHLECLRHVSETLLTSPARNFESHLWALEEYLHGRWTAFAPAISIEMLMERMLEHLAALGAAYDPRGEGAEKIRSDINAARRFLKENHQINPRKAVSQMTPEGAQRLYDRLSSHPALDSSERAQISAALRGERPELDVKAEEDLLSSAYHYVTKAGYDERAVELQRIRTVDIPANSRRIGLAADHGDLTENAEYDAAKEQQARLMNRMNELDDMLRFARVFDPHLIKTDKVWPGTRIRVKYPDGTEDGFVLLGPWDANPDKHILSYRSPLGAQLLKKKVGDTVDLILPNGDERPCRIEAVENALL